MWVNMVAAYENLPDDVKVQIADLRASHSFLDTMSAMIPEEAACGNTREMAGRRASGRADPSGNR